MKYVHQSDRVRTRTSTKELNRAGLTNQCIPLMRVYRYLVTLKLQLLAILTKPFHCSVMWKWNNSPWRSLRCVDMSLYFCLVYTEQCSSPHTWNTVDVCSCVCVLLSSSLIDLTPSSLITVFLFRSIWNIQIISKYVITLCSLACFLEYKLLIARPGLPWSCALCWKRPDENLTGKQSVSSSLAVKLPFHHFSKSLEMIGLHGQRPIHKAKGWFPLIVLI